MIYFCRLGANGELSGRSRDYDIIGCYRKGAEESVEVAVGD